MPAHNCRSLEEAFGEVQSRILKARAVSLYLNFDGTLAPLVANPDDARLPDPTRVALERIAGRSRMLTTILTGRSLFDARKRTGVPGIVYAGNHGMEINGSGLMFVEPAAAACQERLERICESLESKLKAVPGVRIENKRLTATLRHGQADKESIPVVEAALSESVEPYAEAFRVEPARDGFDILPETTWNKAST
ncbi:MAG: trehalose-phosphatase, partial [Bryobacteraceae bacterium]